MQKDASAGSQAVFDNGSSEGGTVLAKTGSQRYPLHTQSQSDGTQQTLKPSLSGKVASAYPSSLESMTRKASALHTVGSKPSVDLECLEEASRHTTILVIEDGQRRNLTGGHQNKLSSLKIGLEVPCDRCCKVHQAKLEPKKKEAPTVEVRQIQVQRLTTQSITEAEKSDERVTTLTKGAESEAAEVIEISKPTQVMEVTRSVEILDIVEPPSERKPKTRPLSKKQHFHMKRATACGSRTQKEAPNLIPQENKRDKSPYSVRPLTARHTHRRLNNNQQINIRGVQATDFAAATTFCETTKSTTFYDRQHSANSLNPKRNFGHFKQHKFSMPVKSSTACDSTNLNESRTTMVTLKQPLAQNLWFQSAWQRTTTLDSPSTTARVQKSQAAPKAKAPKVLSPRDTAVLKAKLESLALDRRLTRPKSTTRPSSVARCKVVKAPDDILYERLKQQMPESEQSRKVIVERLTDRLNFVKKIGYEKRVKNSVGQLMQPRISNYRKIPTQRVAYSNEQFGQGEEETTMINVAENVRQAKASTATAMKHTEYELNYAMLRHKTLQKQLHRIHSIRENKRLATIRHERSNQVTQSTVRKALREDQSRSQSGQQRGPSRTVAQSSVLSNYLKRLRGSQQTIIDLKDDNGDFEREDQ